MVDITVKIADFAGDGADEFGLVGGQVGEGLGAFGVLDLSWFVSGGCCLVG